MSNRNNSWCQPIDYSINDNSNKVKEILNLSKN